jgi:hypothetical protein
MITRGDMQRQLAEGIAILFGLDYMQENDDWKALYKILESEKAFEEAIKLIGFGVAKTTKEGERYNTDTVGEAWKYRFDHEKTTAGFQASEEAIADNLYMSLLPTWTAGIAKSLAAAKRIKAFVPFNQGFSSYKTGDNVALFSQVHPLAGGRTQSNTFATGVDFTEASRELAEQQIDTWTDERGILIQTEIESWHVGTKNKHKAKRQLSAVLQPDSMDNNPNIHKGEKFFVHKHFQDPYQWVAKLKNPNSGIHYVRSKVTHRTDVDSATGAFQHFASERYSFGVVDPFGYFGVQGS